LLKISKPTSSLQSKFRNPKLYDKSPIEPKRFLKKVFDIKIQSASTHEKKKLCHRYIHRPLAAMPQGFLVKDLFALASKKNS